MRRCARGLMAVIGGAVLAFMSIGGASAAPSDAEARAIYEVRAELAQALRDTKVELAEYRAYRDEPRWYIVEGGWGYVDVDRLADYIPIAQYLEDHPDILPVLRADPFWLDAPLIASVSLLTEEAASSVAVPRAAEVLAAQLRQTRDEKAPDVSPYLQDAREGREVTITAIDTLDALIEGLGLPVPGPDADDIRVEPSPEPGPGTSGVMAAFREELAAEVDQARSRVWNCRQWIKDPDIYVDDSSWTYKGFDLARLGDFESAVEFIRDNVWAWDILNAPAARGSDLDIATKLYLQTFQDAPGDLAAMTGAVVEANRQSSRVKRNEYCIGILGEGLRNRDALVDALAAADEITAALGLDVEPEAPREPTPLPTPEPTLVQTPEPTPEPAPTREPPPEVVEPEPTQTPIPDPFTDL